MQTFSHQLSLSSIIIHWACISDGVNCEINKFKVTILQRCNFSTRPTSNREKISSSNLSHQKERAITYSIILIVGKNTCLFVCYLVPAWPSSCSYNHLFLLSNVWGWMLSSTSKMQRGWPNFLLLPHCVFMWWWSLWPGNQFQRWSLGSHYTLLYT